MTITHVGAMSVVFVDYRNQSFKQTYENPEERTMATSIAILLALDFQETEVESVTELSRLKYA